MYIFCGPTSNIQFLIVVIFSIACEHVSDLCLLGEQLSSAHLLSKIVIVCMFQMGTVHNAFCKCLSWFIFFYFLFTLNLTWFIDV